MAERRPTLWRPMRPDRPAASGGRGTIKKRCLTLGRQMSLEMSEKRTRSPREVSAVLTNTLRAAIRTRERFTVMDPNQGVHKLRLGERLLEPVTDRSRFARGATAAIEDDEQHHRQESSL